MTKSIAVFGAGPALGRAVAHRYAREGYTVVLVARRAEPLEKMASELAGTGATAHTVTADLSDTEAVPGFAHQIRSKVGELDAMYYGPSMGGGGGGRAPSALTPERVQAFMPLALYTLVALVGELLPAMVERRNGAVLVATGAGAFRGMPNFAGPGPALAAQRNYLQSLGAELVDKGVYVGRLYIGATIENSAWHAGVQADAAAGRPSRAVGPLVNPSLLADLLWTMHGTRQPETIYPEGLFGA